MYYRSGFLLLALLLASCGSSDESTADQPIAAAVPTPAPPIDPLSLEEVEEISEDGISIGVEPGNEIQVTREGERIRVRLSDKVLARLPQNALIDLGIGAPEVTYTDAGYRTFMTKLHDYLHEHLEHEPKPGDAANGKGHAPSH